MSEVLISVCWWSLGCTLPEPPGPAAEMVSHPPRGERAPREGISSTVFGVLVVSGVTLPEPPGPAAEMVSVLVACAAETSTIRFGTCHAKERLASSYHSAVFLIIQLY